jgi:hypothetical protein
MRVGWQFRAAEILSDEAIGDRFGFGLLTGALHRISATVGHEETQAEWAADGRPPWLLPNF